MYILNGDAMATENNDQKVLIIEDDENLRKFIKLVLENKFNFTVLEAINGREGLEILKNVQPLFIILDLMMTEINGREFLEIIRKKEETKNIPVLVCTCIADRNVVMDLVKIGITDYMVKPINPAQLTNKINEFLKIQKEKILIK
jgi:DNA-binding response OmpR family regulator